MSHVSPAGLGSLVSSPRAHARIANGGHVRGTANGVPSSSGLQRSNTEKNKSRRHGENRPPCLRVSGISAFERRRLPATTGDAAIYKPRRAYLFLWRCAFIRLSYLCFDIFLRRFFLMEPIAFSFFSLGVRLFARSATLPRLKAHLFSFFAFSLVPLCSLA